MLKSPRSAKKNRRETIEAAALQDILDISDLAKSSEKKAPASAYNRRTTADPADLAALLDEVSESPQRSSISMISMISTPEKSTGKSALLRKSPRLTKSPMSAKKLDQSDNNENLINIRSAVSSASKGAKSPSKQQVSVNKKSSKNNRRVTADAADLADLLDDLNDSCQNEKTATDISMDAADDHTTHSNQTVENNLSDLSLLSEVSSRRSSTPMESVTVTVTEKPNQNLSTRKSPKKVKNASHQSNVRLNIRESILSPMSCASDNDMEINYSHEAASFELDEEEIESATDNAKSVISASPKTTGRESIDTIALLNSLDNMSTDLSTSQIHVARDTRRETIDNQALMDLANELEEDDLTTNSSISRKSGTNESFAANDDIIMQVDRHSNTLQVEENQTLENGIQSTPEKSFAMDVASESICKDTAPQSVALKSCLSTKKAPRTGLMSASKKSVIFGSPDAALYHVTSPTNSFTPLDKGQAKMMFTYANVSVAMNKSEIIDEVSHEESCSEADKSSSILRQCIDGPENNENDPTEMNSAILDEWERLTNTSHNNSDNSDDDTASQRSKKRRSKSPSSINSKKSKRRKSMLQHSIGDFSDRPVDEEEEEEANVNDMSEVSEASHTQRLESNLHEFIQDNAYDSSSIVEESENNNNNNDNGNDNEIENIDHQMSGYSQDDRTQQLEVDLKGFLAKNTYSTLDDSFVSTKSDNNEKSLLDYVDVYNVRVSELSEKSSLHGTSGPQTLNDSCVSNVSAQSQDLQKLLNNNKNKNQIDIDDSNVSNDYDNDRDDVTAPLENNLQQMLAQYDDVDEMETQNDKSMNDDVNVEEGHINQDMSQMSASCEITERLEDDLAGLMNKFEQSPSQKTLALETSFETVTESDADMSMAVSDVSRSVIIHENEVDVHDEAVESMDVEEQQQPVLDQSRNMEELNQNSMEIDYQSAEEQHEHEVQDETVDEIEETPQVVDMADEIIERVDAPFSTMETVMESSTLLETSQISTLAFPQLSSTVSSSTSTTANSEVKSQLLNRLRMLNCTSRENTLVHAISAGSSNTLHGSDSILMSAAKSKTPRLSMARRTTILSTIQQRLLPASCSAKSVLDSSAQDLENSLIIEEEPLHEQSMLPEAIPVIPTKVPVSFENVSNQLLATSCDRTPNCNGVLAALISRIKDLTVSCNASAAAELPQHSRDVARDLLVEINNELRSQSSRQTQSLGDKLQTLKSRIEARDESSNRLDAIFNNDDTAETTETSQSEKLRENSASFSRDSFRRYESRLVGIFREAMQQHVANKRAQLQELRQENADSAAQLSSLRAENNERSNSQLKQSSNTEEIRVMKETLIAQQNEIQAAKVKAEGLHAKLLTLEGEFHGLLLKKTSLQTREQSDSSKANKTHKVSDAVIALQNQVNQLRQVVRVVNSTTYCKILEYSTRQIAVEVSLDSSLKIAVTFALKVNQADTGDISIENINIDLKEIAQDVVIDEKYTMLAKMYFAAVMCDNRGDASGFSPLSEKQLLMVEKVRDIPALLQKLNGCVISYRNTMWSLQSLESFGMNWSIGGTDIAIQYKNETKAKVIPLKAFIVSNEWGKI